MYLFPTSRSDAGVPGGPAVPWGLGDLCTGRKEERNWHTLFLTAGPPSDTRHLCSLSTGPSQRAALHSGCRKTGRLLGRPFSASALQPGAGASTVGHTVSYPCPTSATVRSSSRKVCGLGAQLVCSAWELDGGGRSFDGAAGGVDGPLCRLLSPAPEKCPIFPGVPSGWPAAASPPEGSRTRGPARGAPGLGGGRPRSPASP